MKEYLRTKDVIDLLKNEISAYERREEKLDERLEILKAGGMDKRGLTVEQIKYRIGICAQKQNLLRTLLVEINCMSGKSEP